MSDVDVQTVVNGLANRYEAEVHRADELQRTLVKTVQDWGRTKDDLRIANEASLVLLTRAAEAEREVERLRRVERAARKIHGHDGHYPTHLGGCIGVLSDVHCRCGIGDLHFAVRALDEKAPEA